MNTPDTTNEPIDGEIEDAWEALAIVVHPAFRLGFLDAQAGRPIDHFDILKRIYAETPGGALSRLGWGVADFLLLDRVEVAAVAEYRYEEGRLVHLDEGLRCKAWGHPDYPPRAVVEYIFRRWPRPAPAKRSPEDEAALRAEWARRRADAEAAHQRDQADLARQGALAL